MKFPRNAKIFRGQLDVTPFAGVFFCLVLFLLLASQVYTPGVLIQLPASGADNPGVTGPTVAVAMDINGALYFENQVIQKNVLLSRLREEVGLSQQPVTLVLQEDKGVTAGTEAGLMDLARAAGIKQVLLQRLPRMFDAPAGPKIP